MASRGDGLMAQGESLATTLGKLNMYTLRRRVTGHRNYKPQFVTWFSK